MNGLRGREEARAGPGAETRGRAWGSFVRLAAGCSLSLRSCSWSGGACERGRRLPRPQKANLPPGLGARRGGYGQRRAEPRAGSVQRELAREGPGGSRSLSLSLASPTPISLSLLLETLHSPTPAFPSDVIPGWELLSLPATRGTPWKSWLFLPFLPPTSTPSQTFIYHSRLVGFMW